MRQILTLLTFLISMLSYGQDIKIKECFIDTSINIKYCIASDSHTYDQQFGDSYRLFLMIDNINDSILEKIYLDINRSPDFPYLINSKYNAAFGLLLIKGCAMFYLYSPADKKISKQIFPDYTNCNFSDGQGSFIRNLTIDENGFTLELEVMECGVHRFDITNIDNIEEIK